VRVLWIHDFYAGFGGEDAVALADKELLERLGHEVVFYQRHNEELARCGGLDLLAFPANAIYSCGTARDLRRLVRDCAPDVACVHNVFPLISPSVYHVLDRMRIPIAQVVHNFRFWCPNGWLYRKGAVCEACVHGGYWNAVLHRCYRGSYSFSALYGAAIALNRCAGILDKIDTFICLNEFAREKLRSFGVPADKLSLKPNCVASSSERPRHGEEGGYVLYLGRLSAEKGLWTLIEAFQRLPTVLLKVAGKGPLEEPIKRYVEQKRLRNVELVGFAEGEAKRRLLSGSRFVVVPSEWYENFPVVILEAYASAKPVVAANIGSLPHIVDHGRTGVLFQPRQVEELAGVVRELVSDPARTGEMGLAGRRLLDDRFSEAECGRALSSALDATRRRRDQRRDGTNE
jgi:glycosyltransferase involved in cell wall biosynthesis